MKYSLFRLSLTLFLLLRAAGVFSQAGNDDVLMTIAGKRVTVGEFMSIYQKNNVRNEPIDSKAINEYLDLFINFKLKVRQAEELGLDTVTSFRKELQGYRDQLAKPYLTDEATIDRLVLEAYQRSKNDLRASHIFFRLKPDATPEDTLAAYTKASEVMLRLKQGESFEALAVSHSEDPSARDKAASQHNPLIRGNKGDLGYFNIFDMVYAFETGAYNTTPGNISPIIRTDYGYHIIKVKEKREALNDFVVAHIYMMIPRGASANDSMKVQMRIDSIYGLLRSGEKFEDLVRQYSDDKGSTAKGGVLPKRGVNRLVPEFIEPIYDLKNPGDYTAPVLTQYGWHILKLVERNQIKPFDEVKGELKQKVTRDGRANLSRIAVVNRVKQEYGFTENPAALETFIPLVTDSIFFGKWDPTLAKTKTEVLFKIGNLNYRQRDFADYLASKQRKREPENLQFHVRKLYEEFRDDNLIKYENTNLEQKYPEFRALMQEYRDGILLFDLTDQNVWSKAVKDTTGLKDFYQKNSTSYMWDTRLDASIYNVMEPSMAQKIRNFITSGLSDADILKEMNNDTTRILYVESGKFSRKDNALIDSIPWKTGFSGDIRTDSSLVFVYVRKVLKPEPRALSEARGLVTADYQNYLEKEWISELRKKYPVVVNREVLARIK